MIKNHALSGAMAGITSTLTFIIIHDFFISDIWNMTAVMLFAGGLCGLCIGWSYSALVSTHSTRRWLGYNLLYLLMFILLGVTSELVFEPITPLAALMALNGAPDDLIGQALPLTALFTLGAAVVISLFYERSWKHFGAVLLTSIVLVLLLGLNVSVIGLVSIPQGSFYLVTEFLGLIVFLNIIFVVVFIGLEWQGWLVSDLIPNRRN